MQGSYNLPVPLPGDLWARESDLTSIHLTLKAGMAVLLHGLAGIGKTALAASLAAGYAELPGGVLWFDLANDTLPSMLNRVLRAYGVDGAAGGNLDAQRALAGDLLHQNRPLVVLDGQVLPEHAREFVRGCASGVPLLLTHPRMVAGPWTPHAVEPLPAYEAEMMLAQLADLPLDVDMTELSRLSETLRGHALSIVMAARQLAAAGIGPGEFLERMPDLPSGDANRIMGILMAAYRLLPSALQGLVLLVGTTFTGGASEELLSDVGGAPPHVIRATMGQLAKRGFVTERMVQNQPYFEAHELIQTFAQVVLRGKKQLDAMRTRHLNGLLVYARRHTGEPEANSHERLAVEILNIITASAYAAQHDRLDFVEEVSQLLQPTSAESFVLVRGFRPELEWLHYLGKHPEATGLGLLGRGPEPVEVEEEVEISPSILAEPEPARSVQDQDTMPSDPVAAAGIVSSPPSVAEPESAVPEIAVEPEVWEDIAESPPAESEPSPLPLVEITMEPDVVPESAFEDSSETVSSPIQEPRVFQADGSVEDELAAIKSLAALSLQQENYEDVLAQVDRGMALAQEVDNPRREGQMLVVLGDMQAMLGRFEGAVDAYQEAVKAFRPIDAWLDIGLTLDKIGDLYFDLNRFRDAITVWEQTVPIFAREQQMDELKFAQIQLGDAHANLMHWDEAMEHHAQALNLIRTGGDAQEAYEQLSVMADVLKARGDYVGAQTRYQQALGQALEVDDPVQVGDMLLELARLWINDTVQLNRVVHILEAAQERLPDNTEIKRLLGRAKSRQSHLNSVELDLLPPEDDLQGYVLPLDDV